MAPMPGPSWLSVLTTWRPSWGVDAAVLVLGAAYLIGAARVGAAGVDAGDRGRPAGSRWPLRRSASFVAALAAVVFTFDSGVAVFGHGDFAVHMVMHLMLIMVVPALWVAGHPLDLLRLWLPPRAAARFDRVLAGRVARAVTFEATVLVVYTLVVVLTHLTGFMEAMAANPALHHTEQILYLAAGLLFFHTALGVDAHPRRPSYFSRFLLMLLAMGVDTLVGVVLMLEPTSPFPSYSVDGVHLGGAIMWVGGDGLMMLVMVLLGRLWVSDPSQRVDFGPWLESARRTAFADAVGEDRDVREERAGRGQDLDEDEEALAAYNRMLARLERGERSPGRR